MMNDWTRTIYLPNYSHFYAFYSSLSLKQALVWRARRENIIMELYD